MRILHIEDNSFIRKTTEILISQEMKTGPVTVIGCADYADGVRAFETHQGQFNLILVDGEFQGADGNPRTGGIEFLTFLKTQGNTAPVLMLSASAPLKPQAENLGATFIEKPGTEELKAMLESLSKTPQRPGPASSPPAPQPV
jgi:CheY-like chemotaxis protein